MNIMPMSYYPMPSDENSQKKVLQESKTEAGAKLQSINDSKMDDSQKMAASDNIQQKISQINQEIRHEDTKKAEKDKRIKETQQQNQVENKELEKQTRKSNFDIKA